MKCMDVQYHFVRDMVEDKKELLLKVGTLKNVNVDSLKNFARNEKFSWYREEIGIVSFNC
jgi:hypothetical protein